METNKNLERVDSLMRQAFGPLEGEAPAWFETRVMARLAAKREESFWESLRAAAKPFLVSGWALAAALGIMLIYSGTSGTQETAVAAYLNGGVLASWLM